MNERSEPQIGIHRFAKLLACLVVLLISAGALVTSTGSGLSVPDWPLSYGSLNPPNWWTISTVRAEHGHRLIAGTVATLTVLLAIWIGRREPRQWVRRMAYAAVATVLGQALLGGLTVLFFLPTAVSVSHAALAEVFFCLTVTLALVTSPWWRRAESEKPRIAGARSLFAAARIATGLIFVQILAGAVMRHTGSGLAIPDFPLVFGGLIPPEFNLGIAIHYAHRVGALLVALMVAVVVKRSLEVGEGGGRLRGLGVAMAALVVIQISLGGAVILTAKAVVPNTAHVATGATLLVTTLLLTLHSWRLSDPVGEREFESASISGSGARPELAEGA